MIVPSSSEIATNSFPLCQPNFPEEPFIYSTVYDSDPMEAIETFFNLRLVCKDLTKKVHQCCPTFILETRRILLYNPIYAKALDFNDKEINQKCFDAIKKLYSKIKMGKFDFNKWDRAAPKVRHGLEMGRSRQCIIDNQPGDHELWVMLETNMQMQSINLATAETRYINLKEKANQISRLCHPCMARSEKWLAICCKTRNTNSEINIITLDPPIELEFRDFCHRIVNLGEIKAIYCEKEFLYVLCKDTNSEISKLLRYNSNDWTSAPEELCFSDGNVVQFYIGNKEILFASAITSQTQYELSAVKKDLCFSCAKPDFIKAPLQVNYPIIKSIDGALLTITSAPESTITTPVSFLEILDLDGPEITKKLLLKLSVNALDIVDFYVVLDRIFILQQQNWKYSVSCFDLKNGLLLNEFYPLLTRTSGTNFRPTLVIQPAHVKLYFSSKLIEYNYWNCEGTGIMDLDFEVDPINLELDFSDLEDNSEFENDSSILQETVIL